MFKRLSTASGEVADRSPHEGDTDAAIVRPAILVHAGPDKSEVEFQSGDGPIVFDEARIKRVVENQNKLLTELASHYGGIESMPAGAWTPILDQHSDDSNDRVVGRYASLLRYEVRDVPGVGKNVPCAVADIRFLGKDTVDRVKDGRIYHLSIGIDENTDTLGETSTVIEPAAPGAMLLRRGLKQKPKEKKMATDFKKLQAHKERMAKLSAIRDEVKKTQTKLVTARENVRLAKREGTVTMRLSALMKSGRMMPSEFKKMDVKRLAKLSDEDLSTSLMAFEAREKPVIEAGQRGSTDASAFADLGKDLEKRQWKRMRAEAIKDIKRMSGGKVKMKSDDDDLDQDQDQGKGHEMSGPKESPVSPGKDEHVVSDQAGDEKEMAQAHMSLKACLESGDVEGAKAAHEKVMSMSKKSMKSLEFGDVASEDKMKNMDDMQGQVDELNTQMARMAGMVEELMGAEQEEGHDLEAGEEEEDAGKKKKPGFDQA